MDNLQIHVVYLEIFCFVFMRAWVLCRGNVGRGRLCRGRWAMSWAVGGGAMLWQCRAWVLCCGRKSAIFLPTPSEIPFVMENGGSGEKRGRVLGVRCENCLATPTKLHQKPRLALNRSKYKKIRGRSI